MFALGFVVLLCVYLCTFVYRHRRGGRASRSWVGLQADGKDEGAAWRKGVIPLLHYVDSLVEGFVWITSTSLGTE